MKKISMLMVVIISTLFLITPIYAESGNVQNSGESVYSELEDKRGNASITTIKKLKTKEEKIAYYTEKCGSATNGNVMYYLYEIQKYSVPVCFIGLVIASLNFFIIGNKKLDKREQGFGMLIAFGLGLIVFQVLPLLFAIIVAGR
ncbi:MAG: hypothetical protein J6C46_09495 [Clostridia bacterium]|nr:hypothetical protein [Clostridia bacterium]